MAEELGPLTYEEEEEMHALLELERSDNAKRSFLDFCQSVDVPGVPAEEGTDSVLIDAGDETYPVTRVEPAAHHRIIIEHLQAVEAGKIKRLMIFLPPGSAKSTYASVLFPTWFLGRRARRSLICTSYGADLPKKFGRRCRNIVQSPEFFAIMQHGIGRQTKAVDNWILSNGSEYYSSGILGGITGHRADGAVCDDLIKGHEAADSLVQRDKIWEAYVSDLRTRVKPKGFLVYIGTRWHEDDPAGRILPDDYSGESGPVRAKDGEMWHVICIPAKAERADDPLGRKPGEYMWPEWFVEGYFEQEERSQGPRNWNALFQQKPAPEEGSYLRGEWIRKFDPQHPPQYLKFYGASDYAVTEGAGDWTVHGIIGVDPMDNIFVLDWWRAQTSSLEWVETAIDLELKWRPDQWAQEKGQIAGGVGPFLDKRRRERKAYGTELLQFASSRDKATRARSIQGRMRMGMVYFPAETPWADDLVSRILRFRGMGDEIDDDVDVLSLFGRMLSDMHHGSVPMMTPGSRFDSPAYIRSQIKTMALGRLVHGALD